MSWLARLERRFGDPEPPAWYSVADLPLRWRVVACNVVSYLRGR
jgi:hypothetical protein